MSASSVSTESHV